MSRTQRLLDLLQLLRARRTPISGASLADTLGVSLRTLYRDIATLQGQGADIAGEPGLGYVLRPGFMLPPLMFTPDEIEALVLGVQWVSRRTDDAPLGKAGESALAKITAVLPEPLRADVDAATLFVGPGRQIPAAIDTTMLRDCVRQQRKLHIHYANAENVASQRVIWPFGIGFFDGVRIVLAWCEAKNDFRHFRLDRMQSATPTGDHYRRRRHDLLREWRQRQSESPYAAGT